MDSAKNKKSFSDGFSPAATPAAPSGSFRLPDHYWKALESDPGFRAEWDRRMAEAVGRITEETRARVRAEFVDVACKEGFEAGIVESRKAIEGAIGELDRVCRGVIEQKARLLEDHEAKWCQAFVHLLRRFLVPRAEYAAEAVVNWLKESTAEWNQKAAIRVLLPKGSGTLLDGLLKIIAREGGPWVIEIDDSLTAGEIRCESGGIGIAFEPERELKKVEDLVEQILRGEKAPAAAEAERQAA